MKIRPPLVILLVFTFLLISEGSYRLLVNAKESAGRSAEDSTDSKDDSANSAETVKSWTSISTPSGYDKNFLDSLEWKDYEIGSDYILRTGIIYGKWIAAMQFKRKGEIVLTEYTPPSEYVTVLDSATGKPLSKIQAGDANHDGILEIAFLHEKLNDRNYHMYTVYALTDKEPKLLWKSGGKFGNWLQEVQTSSGEIWKGQAKND